MLCGMSSSSQPSPATQLHSVSQPRSDGPPTSLVTGPTSGIGREFARQLAERGHALVLVARDGNRLEELASELRAVHGVEVEVLIADLVDRDDLARVEERLADQERPVHLLVNNAGFGQKRPFLENSIEQEQAMADVLIVAVLRLSHAAMKAMLLRGHGQVVNVSSVAGFLGRGTYGTAKAWVTRFSQWADAEYSDRGVRVMALCPGFVRTEFHQRMEVDQSSAPRFLWLEADALVREALADLDAGKSLSIPTRRYRLICTVARVAPLGVLRRFQSLGRK